jgi:hypothetical protein
MFNLIFKFLNFLKEKVDKFKKMPKLNKNLFRKPKILIIIILN